jgi:mono/diheme cytochrome c family protein
MKGLIAPGATLAVWLAAGAVTAASPPAGLPERGKAIFDARCASCHGLQGKGDGPQAPFLSPRPASLVSAATSAKTDVELLAVIANGKPRTSMTGWKGELSEEERRDVLAYVRSLVRFGPTSLTPPPPVSAPQP